MAMVYFWTLTYAFAFFGSVSFGYLIMRFGMPDTRILPRQIKLGVASIAGFVLFAVSAFIAYFVFTPIYLYAILPAITALALFFIQIRDVLFSSKTMRIAIPVARVTRATTSVKRFEARASAKTAPKTAAKPAKKAAQITMREEEKKPLTAFVSRIEETRATERVGAIQERMERAVEAPERIYARGEERAKKEEPKESPYAAPETTEQKPTEKPATGHRRAGLFGLFKREAAARVSAEPVKITPPVAERPSFTAAATEGRRDRYLRRRGELVEQAKADMTKPTTDVAPLPIISEEEIPLETGEGLDLSDLQSVSDLSELSSEEGLVGLESSDVSLGDLAGLSEIENVPKERGMSCPRCGSKKTMIVYCPYDGKGLCSNCADRVHSEGNLTFYSCPTCKKEVIVKKEA